MLLLPLLGVVVIGLAAALASQDDAVALLVFPILWWVGSALAARGAGPEDRPAVVRLFAFSFLLRAAVAIIVYQFGLVHVLGDEDSSGWYTGWAIAQAWHGDPQFAGVHPDFVQALRQSNEGYNYLAGIFLYLLRMPSRLSLAMLSALAGGLTVVLVYRIARHLFGDGVATRAATWTAIFPSLVIWSAQTLKEPFVILFECMIVYATVVLRSGASRKWTAVLIGSLFCLYTMRFYAAYLSMAAAVLILLWRRQERQAGATLAAAVVLSVAIIGLFASGFWGVEKQRLDQFNLQWVQSFRVSVATQQGSGSGISLPYDVSTPGGALRAFPESFASFLLSPYPWQVPGGSLRLKLSFLEVLLWWWMLPKIVAGLRQTWRTQPGTVGLLMLFIAPFMIFYSLIFGNAGLAFRERAQVLVFLLVFAGVGLSLRKAAAPRPIVGRLPEAVRL